MPIVNAGRIRRLARSLGSSLLALAVIGVPTANAEPGFSPIVDAKGQITLPEGFRQNMVHLGSWFVPEGEASGFHDVYTQPSTVEAYRATGRFPDGAILVKELRASRSGNYTTGQNVRYETDEIKQWFVMVRDREGRFPANPLWAEGWGWALFKPDAPRKNVATSFTKDCQGCHLPARSNDWVYIEAYPILEENQAGRHP